MKKKKRVKTHGEKIAGLLHARPVALDENGDYDRLKDEAKVAEIINDYFKKVLKISDI